MRDEKKRTLRVNLALVLRIRFPSMSSALHDRLSNTRSSDQSKREVVLPLGLGPGLSTVSNAVSEQGTTDRAHYEVEDPADQGEEGSHLSVGESEDERPGLRVISSG